MSIAVSFINACVSVCDFNRILCKTFWACDVAIVPYKNSKKDSTHHTLHDNFHHCSCILEDVSCFLNPFIHRVSRFEGIFVFFSHIPWYEISWSPCEIFPKLLNWQPALCASIINLLSSMQNHIHWAGSYCLFPFFYIWSMHIAQCGMVVSEFNYLISATKNHKSS